MPDSPFPDSFARRGKAVPFLLFLHGAACADWVWQEGFAQACAKEGFAGQAMAFSRLKEDGQPAGLGEYVAQARAAVARLGGPVVLVGHSLGALVAQRLLLEPAVRGAALLAPVPPEGLWFSTTRLAMSDPALWAEAARMEAPVGQMAAEVDPSLVASLFGAAMPPERAQGFLRRMGGESRTALMEAQGPQPVPHGWLHGRPVLVLGAGEDRLIPPDAVSRCALWHGATASFVPGMGHLMMLEPGWPEVAARLLGWLQRL